MALQGLAALGNGLFEGVKAGMQQRNPLAEAQLAASIERQRMMRPYYEATAREASVRADKGELELDNQRRLLQKQQATKFFGEFESLATDVGGYSRAMETPDGQRLFASAYNLAPEREELGLPEVDGFEAINETNFQDWGFTPEDYERMRAERQSEALFVPYRLREGRREPVLEDLDGDGTIDAYGGEQLERMVRPIFLSQERAGQDFAALASETPLGGTVTIGGGGGGRPVAQPLVAGGGGGGQPAAQPLAAGEDSIWERHIQAESNGQQFGSDGNPLISPAGAVGIAQVMPATGPEAARMAGLEWDEERFYNDADYNERLGRAYRNHLRERYNGDEVLATAAYNGGMGNVDKWIRRFGDPRTGEISHADFIRQIPFAETQGYVMKVLGGSHPPQQQPQRQPQQQPQPNSVEQLSQPAIQSAVDVATGYNPNRVPSLIERIFDSGGSGGLADPPPTAWGSMAWDTARRGLDTALEYTIGTDAKEAGDQVADRYVNQPLNILAKGTGRVLQAGVDATARAIDRGINAVTGTTDGQGAPDAPVEQPAEQSLRRHETPLGRRIGEEKGIGPGSAKRAADNEEVLQDVRTNMTPDQQYRAAGELLSSLQPTGTGASRTYSVNSSSGKPTHKQIGHAYSMMARGLISREEFNRFIDTGTISADGVALIERGMQEAAGIATAEIQQQGQTQREWLQQQGQTQRERIKQGDQRDTIIDNFKTWDVIGPSIYGMSQEDWQGPRGGAIRRELSEGIWRWGHQLLGTPNDAHSMAQGHRQLLAMEGEVNPKWYEWYDKYVKGEKVHNLSAMPSMQALAAMDSGLVADVNSTRRTLRSVERYHEIMRAEGNPNSRNPQHEAQSMVNFYLGARQVGVNPHTLDTNSVRYNNLMRIAIQAAQANRPVAEVLAEYAQGSAN